MILQSFIHMSVSAREDVSQAYLTLSFRFTRYYPALASAPEASKNACRQPFFLFPGATVAVIPDLVPVT